MAKKDESAVAVVEEKSTALAAAGLMDFAADAGAGMEGAGQESFAIPFLSVLQKGSPQVDEASGAALEGAFNERLQFKRGQAVVHSANPCRCCP